MDQSIPSESVPSSKAFSQLREDYIYPISYVIMEHPMILPCCGNTFDRTAIQRWLNETSTCPSCRRQVAFNQAIFNRSLNTAITTFKNMMNKKQERRRREVQQQLHARAAQQYSKLVREKLKSGKQMNSQNLTVIENVSSAQKLIRLAIQLCLQSMNKDQTQSKRVCKNGTNQFTRLIQDGIEKN